MHGQNLEFLNIKPNGTFSNQITLKDKVIKALRM
jgi:hypothetical protein